MGRPCTICSHPQREAIHQALREGHSFRDVAVSYAVSKTALHRHWQAHVAVEPISAPAVPARAKRDAATAASHMEAVGRRGLWGRCGWWDVQRKRDWQKFTGLFPACFW